MHNQVNNISDGNNIQSALPTNSNISPLSESDAEEIREIDNKQQNINTLDLGNIRNNMP